MSHQATTWVMEFSESRLADRLVLLAIAHRVSNDSGAAFPSVATICREANLSERQVQYSIKSLEKLGELQVKRSGSEIGTHLYRMPKFIAWMQTLHPAKSAPGAKRAPAKFVPGGAKQHEQNAPEPKDNHHIEASGKPSCAERSNPDHSALLVPPPAPPAAVIELPLNDGSQYPVLADDVAEWKHLYPAVNVEQELRNMRGWLLASKEKRKTRKGIKRFINRWLADKQDKSGGVNGSRKGDHRKTGGAYHSGDPSRSYDRAPDFVVS